MNSTTTLMVLVVSIIFILTHDAYANIGKTYVGQYNITSDGLVTINNHTYFISQPYVPGTSNETVTFHNVAFLLPFGLPANPGGFDVVMVKFPDGINETLGSAPRGSIITVFSNHTSPQAGFSVQINGTLNLLVGNTFENTQIVSPLQQFKSGVATNHVKCIQGFQLIIKSEDGSPACVMPDTANILIERHWAESISSQ